MRGYPHLYLLSNLECQRSALARLEYIAKALLQVV